MKKSNEEILLLLAMRSARTPRGKEIDEIVKFRIEIDMAIEAILAEKGESK